MPEETNINFAGIVAAILLTFVFWLLAKMTFGAAIWLTKLILVAACMWFLTSLLKISSTFLKWAIWIVGGILLWKYVVGAVINALSGVLWIVVVIGAAYLAYKIVIKSESCVSK